MCTCCGVLSFREERSEWVNQANVEMGACPVVQSHDVSSQRHREKQTTKAADERYFEFNEMA